MAYGLALPLVCLASVPFVGAHAAWGLVLYLRLAHRIAKYRRDQGDDMAMSLVYAAYIVPGKFAECSGLLQCVRDLIFRRRSLVLEYKDYQRKSAA